MEKEVLKYGEAPAGIKEVFELCRGFERAYVSLVNVSRGAKGVGSRPGQGFCQITQVQNSGLPAHQTCNLRSSEALWPVRGRGELVGAWSMGVGRDLLLASSCPCGGRVASLSAPGITYSLTGARCTTAPAGIPCGQQD